MDKHDTWWKDTFWFREESYKLFLLNQEADSGMFIYFYIFLDFSEKDWFQIELHQI